MPRIRFTSDPKLPRDIAHLGYYKGVEADLSQDEADRWLRRGVAEIVSPVAAVVSAAPDPVVPIPDDWEAMHHMARISLARRLTAGDPVETVAAADAAITAELDRRTSPGAA